MEDHQSVLTSPLPVVEGIQSNYEQDQHSGLRRNDGDDAEEFGGIPIPEEGVDCSSDDDASIDLIDLDPTPAELIAELLRGRVVRGEDGIPLGPTRVIPAMQDLLKRRNRKEVKRTLQRGARLWESSRPGQQAFPTKKPDSLPDSENTGVGMPYRPDEKGV